jgi:hypothetical protein
MVCSCHHQLQFSASMTMTCDRSRITSLTKTVIQCYMYFQGYSSNITVNIQYGFRQAHDYQYFKRFMDVKETRLSTTL